ncbi:MAG TPA: hypothetical protein VF727_17260 [Allosphingosinicella sp.]|jgi:hypothetical protein
MIEPDPHTQEVRRRQRARSIVLGLLLAGFALLIYGITIVRMG